MRQSIITKYMGPTNFRGSRIKATSTGGHSKTVSYQYELSADDNHRRAARELILLLNWGVKDISNWKVGSVKTGCVFVYDDGDTL
jgi:hypothetical protein